MNVDSEALKIIQEWDSMRNAKNWCQDKAFLQGLISDRLKDQQATIGKLVEALQEAESAMKYNGINSTDKFRDLINSVTEVSDEL